MQIAHNYSDDLQRPVLLSPIYNQSALYNKQLHVQWHLILAGSGLLEVTAPQDVKRQFYKAAWVKRIIKVTTFKITSSWNKRPSRWRVAQSQTFPDCGPFFPDPLTKACVRYVYKINSYFQYFALRSLNLYLLEVWCFQWLSYERMILFLNRWVLMQNACGSKYFKS